MGDVDRKDGGSQSTEHASSAHGAVGRPFDAPNEAGHRPDSRLRLLDRRSDEVQALLLLFALPAGLFILLRPDWYYIQNGLDPYFYTGYAQDLPDALALGQDLHYFVTRWALYLPSRAFFKVFGSTTGFVMMRWALTALTLGVITLVGRRRWGWTGVWVAGLAVLLSPMYLRAIFTDYSDAIVLPGGVVTVALLACRPESLGWAAVAGASAALVVDANAFAASMVGIALIGSLALGSFVSKWRGRLVLVGVFSATFTTVIVAGLVLFRWRYGIDNVYSPTVDFIRTSIGTRDPLKRSTLEWTGHFLWIYLPPATLGLALLLWRVGRVRFDRAESTLLGVCALQYIFQVYYQFGRDGSTLELSYYWVYMLPAYFLASSVVIGRSVRRSPPQAVIVVAVTAVLLLAVTDRIPTLFATWVVALIAIGAVIAVAAALHGRLPVVLASVAFLIPIAVPLGAPRDLTVEAGDFDVRSEYQTVFHASTSPGQQCFAASTWFIKTMNSLGDVRERAAFFWVRGSICSQPMVATAVAHINDHMINVGDFAAAADPLLWARIGRDIEIVVLVGDQSGVAAMNAELSTSFGQAAVLLDAVSPSADRTLVRILDFGNVG